jgi:hypothetical protein
MRVFTLAVVFVLVFVGTLIARAPLEPLLSVAKVRQRGLAYESAVGTVWGGEIAGLRVGPERLGDVRLALDPKALLGGRVLTRFDIQGPLRAHGAAAYALGRGWRVQNATFAASMSDMGSLHPELKDRGGELFAALANAEVDADGDCLDADGRVETDVLARGAGGAVGDWRGPALTGVISCEAGDVVLRLAGADDSARVVVEARIDLATGSTFVATVQTEDPTVRLALGALGFAEQGGSFAYTMNTSFTGG